MIPWLIVWLIFLSPVLPSAFDVRVSPRVAPYVESQS